jgi:hypothetical protein
MKTPFVFVIVILIYVLNYVYLAMFPIPTSLDNANRGNKDTQVIKSNSSYINY